MPKKLDICVQKVKEQMVEKGKSTKEASRSAYTICSKSTGYVKTGAHTWEKKKKENLEETHNYYKFGLCFKKYRKDMKNSEAWKLCLKKPEFQDMTKIIQGDNMNLNESVLLKIDTLLENAVKS